MPGAVLRGSLAGAVVAAGVGTASVVATGLVVAGVVAAAGAGPSGVPGEVVRGSVGAATGAGAGDAGFGVDGLGADAVGADALRVAGVGPAGIPGAVCFGSPVGATSGRDAAVADFVRGGGSAGLDAGTRVDADCVLAAGAGDAGTPPGESGVPSFDGGFVDIAISMVAPGPGVAGDYPPQHFLYFLPEPHGQGSLRPAAAPPHSRWTAAHSRSRLPLGRSAECSARRMGR
jgi:hypothetical protein